MCSPSAARTTASCCISSTASPSVAGSVPTLRPGQVFFGEVVQVLLDRLRQRQVVLDAVEPGAQHDREGQVGVAGRVRAAQLDARRLPPLRAYRRDANQRRAVGVRPADVDGRLEAWHQPAVGVDQRREDRGHAARVVRAARR